MYTHTHEYKHTHKKEEVRDMKIIAVSNQKGGVGKTTTATNVAYGLQLRGKKVLLVDSDPQGNSTDTWRAKNTDSYPTLSDLLFSNEPVEECIQHTEIGDILAGDPILEDAEKHLKGVAGYFRLKNRLAPLEGKYDYVIIDTPPNLGLLLQNALIAADGVIVPVTCGRYSLQGMSRFIETVNEVKAQPNPDLKIYGLLLVRYIANTLLAKDVVEGLPALTIELGTDVFDTKIRNTIEVEKAQAARVPLEQYSPESTAAIDYMDFIDELEKRGIL